MNEVSKDNTNHLSTSSSEQSKGKETSIDNEKGFLVFLTDRQKTLLTILIIFSIALAIRFVYLYESSDNPSFDVPIVDAAKYDLLARTLVKTGRINDEFFWQPFFYPVFLAAVYALTNSSILAAKIIQAILGAVTCCMTFYLGKTVFNRRCGIISALIMCFYGPLIFFETELLAVGWATFWMVVLLLLFIKTSQSTKLWLFFLTGLIGAASIITRPTFLPFFVVGCLWLAFKVYRASLSSSQKLSAAAVTIAGFALIAGPVVIIAGRTSGRYTLLPSSGGINLYIGNNPDTCTTLIARPNYGWYDIVTLPDKEGISGDNWVDNRFFKQKVMQYASSQPVDFTRGLLLKTLQFFSSREIPRNTDVYVIGKWSRLLSTLAWKAGVFGFPFGLLLPLALIGLIFSQRNIPGIFIILLLLYPLSIILVFVSARYRLPIIPVMAVLATTGILQIINFINCGRWHHILLLTCLIIVATSLSTLPGTFCTEKLNFEAELYTTIGDTLYRKGQISEVKDFYQKALEIEPFFVSALTNLGQAYIDENKSEEGIKYLSRALEINPDHARAHLIIGSAFYSLGELEKASRHIQRSLYLRPLWEAAHNSLALVLHKQKRFDKATEHYQKAIELRPDFSQAYNNLAATLEAVDRLDEAIEYYQKALIIKDDYFDAHLNLASLLSRLGRLEEAIEYYQKASILKPENSQIYYKLGESYAALGKIKQAAKNWKKSVKLGIKHSLLFNNIAWVLSAYPDMDIFEPNEAMQFAEMACKLTDYQNAEFLDTLAVCYAAAGRFNKAVTTIEKAIDLAAASNEPGLVETYQKRLALYKANKPYKESVDMINNENH